MKQECVVNDPKFMLGESVGFMCAVAFFSKHGVETELLKEAVHSLNKNLEKYNIECVNGKELN